MVCPREWIKPIGGDPSGESAEASWQGPRNGNVDPSVPPQSVFTRGYATTDLRVAMEAIAHMSSSHTEAMRALALAQADWIKTLATVKALPRNGYIPLPPPTPAAPSTELAPPAAHEEDDDDDIPDATMPPWLAPLMPMIPSLVQALGSANLGALLDWRKAAPPVVQPRAHASSAVRVLGLQARLTDYERRLFAELCASEAAVATSLAEEVAKRGDEDALQYLRAVLGKDRPQPPRDGERAAPAASAPRANIAAVVALLTPDELAMAMELLSNLTNDERVAMEARLAEMSPSEAAAAVRAYVASVEGPVRS